MSAPILLLLGMAVVVFGILVFRLHAFLALIAGALVVALLTPTRNTYLTAARPAGFQLERDQHSGGLNFRIKPHQLADGVVMLAVPGYGGVQRGAGKVRIRIVQDMAYAE